MHMSLYCSENGPSSDRQTRGEVELRAGFVIGVSVVGVGVGVGVGVCPGTDTFRRLAVIRSSCIDIGHRHYVRCPESFFFCG